MGNRNNEGKKGKGCQGTHIKDPWTNPKGEGWRVGDGDGWGGESGGEKMETTVFEQQLKNKYNEKLFKNIYLFLERGKEGERERNMNVWLPLERPLLCTQPATQAHALTRN